MSSPFNLPFPPQSAPKALGLDASSGRLVRWGASLNLTDLGSSTKALLEQLRLTNRADLKPATRYEWLESLAAPMQAIVSGLQKHYLHQPFPLPPKGMAVAQLANTLHGELMLGYRLLLAARPDTSLLGRRGDRQRRMVACYRLFLHAGEILCNQRLTYHSTPAGMWRHLHAYFAHVTGHGWGALPMPGAATATIDNQYKKMLLLSLLPSQMFPASEWQELNRRLDEWGWMASLHGATQRAAGRRLYCVRFDLDAALAAPTEACCGACDTKLSGVLLDTAPLIEALEWRIAGSVPHQAPFEHASGECRLAPETLQLLLRAWRIPTAPREQRRKVELPLRLVAGLHAIHQMLADDGTAHSPPAADDAPPAHGIAVPNFTLAEIGARPAPGAFPDQAFLGQRDSAGDVWDTVYVGKELPPPVSHWSDGLQREPIEPLAAHALDASSSGYRVELELPEQHDFRLGELVAVCEPRQGRWKLCLLRWIRPVAQQRAALGLEWIGDEPQAIEVRVSGQKSVPATLHGLTGYDPAMNPVLLMPLLPSLTSKRLAITHGGHTTDITLGKDLAFSPLFESFLFTAVDSAQEAAARQAEPRPPQRDTGEDPFGDIWRSL